MNQWKKVLKNNVMINFSLTIVFDLFTSNQIKIELFKYICFFNQLVAVLFILT